MTADKPRADPAWLENLTKPDRAAARRILGIAGPAQVARIAKAMSAPNPMGRPAAKMPDGWMENAAWIANQQYRDFAQAFQKEIPGNTPVTVADRLCDQVREFVRQEMAARKVSAKTP